MTPSEQNRAIAEWMGWTKIHTGYPMDGIKPGSVAALRHLIPNYHGDLNALHEAVVKLDDDQFELFIENLHIGSMRTVFMATAPQRCEALLRTLGLWKDGE